MIIISDFKDFLKESFPLKSIYIDEFKPDLQFVEVDCFNNQSIKLAIEISTEMIKISTISEKLSIDFSLYDYVFDNISEAEKLLLEIKKTGIFPSRLG